MSVPLTLVVFDVLRHDGVDLTTQPYSERRRTLSGLELDGAAWTTSETFDDGPALFTAVCELGFEGIVAKSSISRYQPNERGWIKVKNPNYWRRDAEREAMTRKHERRERTRVLAAVSQASCWCCQSGDVVYQKRLRRCLPDDASAVPQR